MRVRMEMCEEEAVPARGGSIEVGGGGGGAGGRGG